jgi:signal transduction histidine kinase
MTMPQQDHEYTAALLDLMLATNEGPGPRELAEQAIAWLLARDGMAGAGIWLNQSGDLVCIAQRHLNPDAVVPIIYQAISGATSVPLTAVYQRDLRLTILPMGSAGDPRGALVVAAHTPPDPGEVLLLRAAAAHLAATITRPASRVKQAAQTLDREWEEFLGHAAHEIKNPLASIKGYADLLLRRAAKDPADPYHKGLATISQQVGRTTSLLDQLSDITRIGAGRLSIDRHEANFVPIVDQVVHECQSADPQHTITFDTNATKLIGRFDQGRIAQVIGAVIGNALKFSLDGGVVRVLLQRSHADNGNAIAQLAVTDTGVGVPYGEQERIFERFFRGSNIRGTYAGLGVGLYIARAIVDRHGGRLWLESQPALQTTCHLELPLES